MNVCHVTMWLDVDCEVFSSHITISSIVCYSRSNVAKDHAIGVEENQHDYIRRNSTILENSGQSYSQE